MAQHPSLMPAPATARRRPVALDIDADPRRGITRLTVAVPDQETRTRSVLGVPTASSANGLDIRKAADGGGGNARTQPDRPRWRSWEFCAYYAVYIVGLPMLCWVPIRLSRSDHPNYSTFAHRLSPGWLFGWPLDDTDGQWRKFRSNIPSLLLLATVFLAFSYLCRLLSRKTTSGSPAFHPRLFFLACANLVLLVLLHGGSAPKILLILLANDRLTAHCAGPRWFPGAVWAINGAMLFLNERSDGWAGAWSAIHPALSGLDRYGGLVPRWHVGFNVTMLRLVSYCLDAHWGLLAEREEKAQSSAGESVPLRPVDGLGSDSAASPREEAGGQVVQALPRGHKQRAATRHGADEYNLLGLLAYTIYPPLYIAGPIMTYNDFLWQLKNPKPIPPRQIASYGLRFITCLLTMEVILHSMHVVAIKEEGRRAWEGDSAAELGMIGFWNLIVVWLKLLIPWRFFRLWALMDGMDPPENMIRCMANNCSTLGFWRSWHRSYNLWIVRYIYIPLGGSKNPILATGLVFSFVALWHDLSFRLLAWGWLVSLFIMPELAARRVFSSKKFGDRPWYRHLAAFGGACNVFMMMSANLVGFVIGVDGTKYMLETLFGTRDGLHFTLIAFVCLFASVQLMLEYREEEARQGIQRNC